MIHLFNIEEWAEKHLQGNLSPMEEKLLVETLAKDQILKTQFDQSIKLLQSLADYQEAKKVKSLLQEVEKDLLSETEDNIDNQEDKTTVILPFVKRVKSFSQKYWRTSALAASIALCSSLLTYNVATNSTKDSSNNQYTLLKRDIESIKRSQNSIINNIKSTNTKSPELTPANFGGSGFAVSNQGHIATNYHVVEGADSIYIQSNDGNYYKARIISSDVTNDLAILKVEDESFKMKSSSLPYSLSKNASALGQKVFTIGYPRDEVVYNEGYISSESGYNKDTSAYQIEVTSNPGQSGAPVFDNKGNIIALITAKQKNTTGTTYAVHSSALLSLINELPTGEKVKVNSKHYSVPNNRVDQIKYLRDYVFSVKVYK